jgi:RecQ mediated genome instability protein
VLQLEDWVDVSLGKEARILQETSNNNNNTPSSSQCLKFFLTDGTTPPPPSNDSHRSQEVPSHPPILAMQVTPLAVVNTAAPAAITPSIQAGCKILLHGHVIVRYGMLQLHSGNAILLGGHVPELVHQRKNVLEQLQKEGMVGVDPTIRALIGTHSTEEDEEDDENDNNDNSDPADERVVIRGDGTGTRTAGPGERQVVAAVPNHRHPSPRRVVVPPAPVVPSHPVSFAMDPPQPPWTDQPTAIPHHPPLASPPPPRRSSTTNPYQPSTSSTVPATATRNPLVGSGVVPLPATRTTSHLPAAATPPLPVAYNPYTPLPATTNSMAPATTAATTTTIRHSHSTRAPLSIPLPPATTNNATIMTPLPTLPPPPTRIAFADLYALLHRRIVVVPPPHDDPSTTVRPRTSTSTAPMVPSSCWLVEMKQWGTSVYFNIGKEKTTMGSEKKKNKVYYFEMHATFGDMSHNHNNHGGEPAQSSSHPHLIACQLPSTLIEPLFEASPSQLRALARTDKAASQRMAQRGGEQVKQVFFEPFRTWKATFRDNDDKNNNNSGTDSGEGRRLDDIKDPILVLEPFE